MNLAVALSAAATLVAFAFCLSTIERWTVNRNRHDAAWSISLAFFAVATAALWFGLGSGWDEATYRIFYLFGAVLNVPVLALGTLYLLGDTARVDRLAVGVSLWLAVGVGVVLATPLTGSLPETGLPTGADHFGALARTLAAVNSAVGAVILIAGAGWSAVRILRGRSAPREGLSNRRMASANVSIAVGTIVLGVGGSRFETPTAFALTTTVGITVIFAGFLMTTRAKPHSMFDQARTTN